MSNKKTPLNFADPAIDEAASDTQQNEDILHLDMPAIPGDQAPETAEPRPVSLAPGWDHAAPPKAEKAQRGYLIYVLALAASLLWAGGLGAFAYGYHSHLEPFNYEPFAAAVLALLAIGPIGLIWISAFALRQGALLLREARRMQSLSDQMLGPAALAAASTGSAVDAVRVEIDAAMRTVSQARGQLLQLRHGLSEEAQRLFDAAAQSERTAAILTQSLGEERNGFSELSGRLEAQTAEIGDAIGRHARMVAEASDLAQAQIHEAEAALAARAADLAAAAGEAADAARMAGDDLSRQTARLEAAGLTVGEQVQVIEDGLGQQRAALVALAHTMRADQEDLALNFESQKAQFQEILNQAQQETGQLSEASLRGAETVQQMLFQAAEQLRDLSDQAQNERDLLGGSALQSLGAFSEAAAFERRALEEETRRAIDELTAAAELAHKQAAAASESARSKVEQLSEAAFAAGQKADSIFESRLSDARSLIDRSVQLVDEAGARTSTRLEQGIEAARSAMEALHRSLGEIEARSARLPADAEARGVQVKTALDAATQSLMDSARTAASELQAIDAGFQERVKRNYEMLSEAVRLMGVMGGGGGGRPSSLGSRSLPPLGAPTATPSVAGAGLRPRVGEQADARRPASPAPAPEPTPRQRLKLTPTTSDEELKTVFEPAAPSPRPAPDGDPESWSWKELLSSLEGEEPDEARLEDSLMQEIDALGIEPQALLPPSRLNEIAAQLELGDFNGAREIAHRVAPAAIRKLARRVLSDKLLRAQADRYLREHGAKLRDAVRRGESRFALAQTLNCSAGRAYVLYEAAVGDLS